MKYDDDVSPGFVHPFRNAIYNSSIAPSASASTASGWSDVSSQTSESFSQTSDDASVSGNSSDGESCDSICFSKQTCSDASSFKRASAQAQTAAVPVELRQNPRRTSVASNGRGCPPPLVRQSDRKVNFVDNLVDSSTQIVDAIWPPSSPVCRSELGTKAVLPLRTFIQETLRRSRTSYSTLQVALYYLILIKPHVPMQSFTTEQLDDRHTTQALQCGRRMFLAALILASKYLQDRNYSARAWSKISGLATHEINRNEMAFLQAVNWKLHITDEVYQRWTDIVIKYTPPPSPPSPGGAPQLVTQQHDDWKHIILGLNTELTNMDKLLRTSPPSPKTSDLSPVSPRSILNMAQASSEMAPAPKTYGTPIIMEPMPTSMCAPGRMAPALTMLPTPRLTPQSSGLSTPAAGATSQLGGKGSSMSLAMAQANCVSAAQYLDRPPTSVSPSPQGYCPARRSSLANSVSTTSSPESMVSDSSRSSRSSSISSASSLASATMHSTLSAPSRFRVAKLGNERLSSKPTVPSVPEDYDDMRSSPESYTGPVGRLGDWTNDVHMVRRKRSLDDMADDADSVAARTLQELHSYRECADATRTATKPVANLFLQDNVRSLLNGQESSTAWPTTMVRSRHVPEFPDTKRVCCAAEAANGYGASRGPGLWQTILN